MFKAMGKGIGIFFAVMFVIALAVLALGGLMWLVGLLMVPAGIITMIVLPTIWWLRLRGGADRAAISAEVKEMARECEQELSSLQMELWKIHSTKGVGTKFQDSLGQSNLAISSLIDQCEGAMKMCATAPATVQRLEAVSEAQRVMHDIRKQLI